MSLFGGVMLIPYFLNALSQNTYFWFVFNTFKWDKIEKSIKERLGNGRLWYLDYGLFFLSIYLSMGFFITTLGNFLHVIFNLG